VWCIIGSSAKERGLSCGKFGDRHEKVFCFANKNAEDAGRQFGFGTQGAFPSPSPLLTELAAMARFSWSSP
jgi:hypothetical protein